MTIKQITIGIDKFLKPQKFVKNKVAWSRRSEVFVDVLNVQLSKSGDLITVNTGVFHPEIYAKCWGKKAPDFIEEPFCIVRSRIGQLDDGHDCWWSITEPDLVQRMGEKITSHVLPFLDEMHSLEKMEHFLSRTVVIKKGYPPPIIYQAILKYMLGDVIGAYAILESLKTPSKDWNDRIRVITDSLKKEI